MSGKKIIDGLQEALDHAAGESIADQIRALKKDATAAIPGSGQSAWNIAISRAADIAAAGEAALRAEVEALRAEVEKERRYLTSVIARHNHLASENDALRADRDRLAADLAVAREALEFYADAVAYEMRYVTRDCGCCTDDYIPAIQDGGDRARAALARITGGDNG